MKLVIQIPCLNEEKSLPVTIKALPEHINGIDEIEILIIDDGSTDRTLEVARELGVKEILSLGINKGLAKAFTEGINKSLEMGADIIVNTDADNQYNAEYIENLVKPVLENRADIVIGTRPVSKIKHFSLLKKILQHLSSCVMRFVSKTDVKSVSSEFWAFSRNAALQLNLFAGIIPGARFVYYFLTGSGQGHIQSLILSAILLLTGVQISLIAVLAELISFNRKLIEDVQRMVKSAGLKKNSEVIK